VALTIDLDDLSDFDPELEEAVRENTRRYSELFADVVHEILPNYKEREVQVVDSSDINCSRLLLDLYIYSIARMF